MSTPESTSAEDMRGPVVFFDAECGLCRRCVRLLLRIDRRGRLRFAPLQGATAQTWLRERGLPPADFDSMALAPDWARDGGRRYLLRTEALLAALREAGGIGRVAGGALGLVPAGWRDAFYRGVARCRHRVFGRGVPWARAAERERWPTRFLP